MTNVKWYVGMIAIVALLIGSVIAFNLYKFKKMGEYFASMPEPEFQITAAELLPQDWVPKLESFGFIEPYQGVTLANETAGTVVHLGFESGQKVNTGDLLINLDATVEQANLEAARAKLPATEAQAKRLQKLYGQGSVSEGQRDEAMANFLSLKAEIASLQATINRRTIKAPFSGVVGLRNVFLGDYLNAGTEIVRLEDISTMRLRFTLPQTLLSQVAVGQRIEVGVDAYPDKTFTGTITAIEPAVNYQSGLVQLQADIPNTDQVLRSGMFARVNVLLPTLKQQMVVPQIAINYTLYGNNVFVVEKHNENGNEVLRARPQEIQVAERRAEVARIGKGLEPGQLVVTSGQLRLSNGSKVKLAQGFELVVPAAPPAL